jgi:hypothetical protein
MNVAAHGYKAGKNFVKNVRLQARNCDGTKNSGEYYIT